MRWRRWEKWKKWEKRRTWFLLLAAATALVLLARRFPIRGRLLDPRALGQTYVEDGPFPRRMTDPVGGERSLLRPPQRIASATLASDEILLEILPPTALVAVTTFVDDPAFSGSPGRAPASLPRITGELETILSLQPDLIVLAGYSRAEMVTQLLALGTAVVRLDRYTSFADILRNIRLLGRATGTDLAAATLVQELEGRLAHVAARMQGQPRPRVLFWQPGGYTAGPPTVTDEIIERAGGHNAARDARFEGNAVLSTEGVLGLRPDVIVLGVPTLTSLADASNLLPAEPAWRTLLSGSRPCRVVGVPAAWIGSLSQHAVRGLEALAELLHPELPHDSARPSQP